MKIMMAKLLLISVVCTALYGCTTSTVHPNTSNTADSVIDFGEASGSTETTDVENEPVVDTGATKPGEAPKESESAAEELSKTDSDDEETVEESDDELTATQKEALNMLNYMSMQTYRVDEGRSNRVFLDSVYKTLKNNMNLNAINSRTKARMNKLMDTIFKYQMLEEKKDRLEFIYEKNKAQAMREAIPDPRGLLSAVMSGNMLKGAASVLYMAADSIASYQTASSQAELEYIKSGWELEDEEAAELHESAKETLSFMIDIVNEYDIPGDYTLNETMIKDFVEWSDKSDDELEGKIHWFETHENTYYYYGPYWLELAKDYYNYGKYSQCLEAIRQYERVTSRITRTDYEYANTLPMAILSAQEVMSKGEYEKYASNACELIINNTYTSDWELRYFTALIYMELYKTHNKSDYLDKAYELILGNVVELAEKQKSINKAYLEDVVEVEPPKDATKRQIEENKQYNALLQEERKVAVPPIHEPFYVNCELLFAIAEEKNISSEEMKKIENIIHVNGSRVFLAKVVDDKFWFENKPEVIDANEIDVKYDAGILSVPASCITEQTFINVIVENDNLYKAFVRWTVSSVDRPDNSSNCEDFIVNYYSEAAGDHVYSEGDIVSVCITPLKEYPDEKMVFKYRVRIENKWWPRPDLTIFERIIE